MFLSSELAPNLGKRKEDTNLRSHGVPLFFAPGIEETVEKVCEDVEADVHGADSDELLVASFVERFIVGTINVGLCVAVRDLLGSQ